MEFFEIVQAELIANDINLCVGCEEYASHSRGFAVIETRTVHYSKKCATRSTLHGFLHEVGHIVKGHTRNIKLKRWQRESEAEAYATQSLRDLSIPVPRKSVNLGKAYVKHWKQFGKKVTQWRNK